MSTDELFQKGERIAQVGFISVAVMGFIKGLAGFGSGSISLQAQAVDSLTDLFSLSAVYLGLKLSSKPPSERFTYGYYRFESLVSLLIAVILAVTGGGVLWQSVTRIINPVRLSQPLNALLVAGLSAPILTLLYRRTQIVGKEINSQALLSQAADFKADIYSSVLVFIGVLVSWLGYPWVEGVASAVVSLIILRMGITLTWQGLLVLMDAVEKPEQLIEVKMLAQGVRGVIEATNVRMRRSGPFCFGEITIKVDQRLPVEQAHRLSNEVESKIKEVIQTMESLIVHIEPMERKDLRVVIPVAEDKGMGSKVSPHFGSSPYFLFIDLHDGEIMRWFTLTNPGRDLEKKRGKTITDLLLSENANVLLSDEVGEGPFHILRDSFVQVLHVKGGDDAQKAVEQYQANELEHHNMSKK